MCVVYLVGVLLVDLVGVLLKRIPESRMLEEKWRVVRKRSQPTATKNFAVC